MFVKVNDCAIILLLPGTIWAARAGRSSSLKALSLVA
jgi:hypothetical protein